MPQSAFYTIRTAGWHEGSAKATTLEVTKESIQRMSVPEHLPKPHDPASLKPPPTEDPEVPIIGKWAAVVLHEHRDAAAEALAPLIAHRRDRGHLWKDGVIAVRQPKSRTMESWCRRLKTAAGGPPPHYLLLVGGPRDLPFEFQFYLDRQRLTGRLDAGDKAGDETISWEACRRYAEKVVAYEQGAIGLKDTHLFYSLQSDEATRVSHEYLILELEGILQGVTPVSPLYGEEAMVDKLLQALAAPQAPKVVFTASHGIEFPKDPVRWGALTDAAFRGRPGDKALSAHLVAETERFGHGSIVFAFACFSAGVPECSNLSFLAGEKDILIKIGARTADLPRQLLGHSHGPVAFVGHVDRVTAHALLDIAPYRDFIGWLRYPGGTLGQALGTIREHSARLGAEIATALENAARPAGNVNDIREAGSRWIGFHDFRGFMLMGDPAITPPRHSEEENHGRIY